MLHPVLRILLIGFYAYGAAVHVANMASLTGFDWSAAPLKWQVLDIVYLVLDVIVVVGLAFAPRAGVTAFIIAAASQISLYTIFHDWVLDVPDAFAPSEGQRAYLNTLVGFHIISLVLVLASVTGRMKNQSRSP